MAALPLDAVLDRVDVLSGRPRTISDLGGGLTNTNLRVTTDDGDYVVRLSANTTGLLGIDRDAEYANSVRAHAAGVGAEVVAYLPEEHVLVIRFLPGRTLDAADVAPRTARIAAALRALHAGPSFVSDFDMRTIRRRYLDVVLAEGFPIPADYLDLAPAYERLEDALALEPESFVPCNNDLLAANFIDDGERIWIIDYEYAGQNEPSFELGNLASENGLDEAQTAALVTAYWGAPDDRKVARALAWALLARYGWTLWAAIQTAVSEIDFDFASWGMEKYAVAREAGLDGTLDTLRVRLGAPR
ncbi:MAG TPA: phosphotransferase [Actinomycetes bacterium]|nr:phosphotransferase [Actinomycetes bacterium]